MKNIELLKECKLQFEYLNEKFGETGTTNAMIGKIDTVLNLACVMGLLPINIDYALGTKRGYCPKCKQFLNADHLHCYKCGVKLNWMWDYEKLQDRQ